MKVILNGAAGHMGREVLRFIDSGYRGSELAAGVDIGAGEGLYKSLKEYDGPADVIVDFSFHAAVGELLEYAVDRGLPVVVATTGHDAREEGLIKAASSKIPVFHCANMSMGVALLTELAVKAAQVFPEADIEIVETHHKRKVDAPSGTALMLAKAIAGQDDARSIKSGRSGYGVRQGGEIGISSVRRGNIVGIHEVILTTETETITIGHEAHDRALFAQGALAAAAFIAGRTPGLYTMQDMIMLGGN